MRKLEWPEELTPELSNILGLVAQRERVLELEAKLEQACDQLNAAMIGQRERQEQFERMAALCDQAIEQRKDRAVSVESLSVEDLNIAGSQKHVLRNALPKNAGIRLESGKYTLAFHGMSFMEVIRLCEILRKERA